jgi:ring-1,2-phenylacetyl-CoA epoxidase subunit PaaE
MSTPHFHSLKIDEVRKETSTCVSVSLQIPEELRLTFSYQSGQYITLKKTIEGEEIRRSYSLCSSPFEKDFRVAIKQVDGGLFSTFANHELKAGEHIEVMNPMGNFTLSTAESNVKNYMAFAAGSGITPILSLIKSVMFSEPQSKFTLIYGNQNISSIIFKEEIDGLKNKYMNRLQIIHVLSRERMETELNRPILFVWS